MKTILSLFLAGAFLAGCQKSSDANPVSDTAQNFNLPLDCSAGEAATYGIIGGRTVQENSTISRSVVLIKTDFGSKGQAFCTASLISKNILLTAAHCVVGKDNKSSQSGRVFFSTNPACAKQQNQLTSIAYKKVIAHSDYKAQGLVSSDDVALILLESDAPQGSVPLDVLTDFNLAGLNQRLFAVGYGSRKGYSRSDEYPVRLRVTHFEASQVEKKGVYLAASRVITIEQKKSGVCAGDSGGPLIYLDNGVPKVLGVASTVLGDPNGGGESCSGTVNYKSLLNEKNWILETMAELNL